MVEVFILDPDAETRARLEALRIFSLRRQITRSNALRALDAQIIREATAAGHRRGAALSIADTFMDAVAARIAEIEKLAGKCAGRANIVNLPRKEAAA